MSEWQPIETAPLDTDCLFYQPGGKWDGPYIAVGQMQRIGSKTDKLWFTISHVGGCECEQDFYHPTHWMPLPEPPRE